MAAGKRSYAVSSPPLIMAWTLAVTTCDLRPCDSGHVAIRGGDVADREDALLAVDA